MGVFKNQQSDQFKRNGLLKKYKLMEILNHLRNEVGKWIKLGLHLHHKPQD